MLPLHLTVCTSGITRMAAARPAHTLMKLLQEVSPWLLFDSELSSGHLEVKTGHRLRSVHKQMLSPMLMLLLQAQSCQMNTSESSLEDSAAVFLSAAA